MNKQRYFLSILLLCLMLAGCRDTADKERKEPVCAGDRAISLKSALLANATASYYGNAAENDKVLAFMKRKSIQRFLAMWVREETGDIEAPIWDYASLSPVMVKDLESKDISAQRQLYSCVFSDGSGRYGYCLFEYLDKESAITNWGVKETTPYRYDLQANSERIADSLLETDIDLLSANASRVCLYDEHTGKTEQVIVFTDHLNDSYICSFETATLKARKWKPFVNTK